MSYILEHVNYWVAILLMMAGLYVVIVSANLVKKLLGLGLFQVSVLLLYISLGYVRGGHAPILAGNITSYANPLPHVLMLTAIVVGVATLAVGLAIVARIREEYGTTEDDDIRAMDDENLPAKKTSRKKGSR